MESCFYLDNLGWTIFDEINDAVLVFDIETHRLLKNNKIVVEIFGCCDVKDLQSYICDCLATGGSYTIEKMNDYVKKAINGQPQDFEWRAKNKEGGLLWVKVSVKSLVLDERHKILLMVLHNKTPCKLANEKLLKSEARFREFAESLPEVVYEIDLQANLTFCNNAAFDFFGVPREEFDRGINVIDYLCPEDRERCLENMAEVMQGRIKKGGTEYTMVRTDGTRISTILHTRPIIKDGHPVGFRGFIVDITELKKNKQELGYLSYHDSLTGLYNRHYFEQRLCDFFKSRRKLCIVVCDIDGLKIINDTLGHKAGDERLVDTANMINALFVDQGIVARVGGEEFAVLLPDADLAVAQQGIDRITEAVDRYNSSLTGKGVQVPLSLSFGMAYTPDGSIHPWKLFEEADNNMCRQKLYRHQSTRSAVVQTLLKALEARDFITEGHADRLKDFVSSLGRSLNLPDNIVTNLCLLAHFHDIGKVGIPDRILFKKGKLTPEEFKEMQRHSEIGFRIAQSSPDLAPIADLILKHHEWWNGQGYPIGLKGEEIPVECRILAIADAYDAMTNDRPYRKAMTSEEAVRELKEGAGVQFDPELVEVFVNLVPKLL